MCAARPNGLLPFKVFALYGSEDRIQAFSTKNGLVFGLGWSFGERQLLPFYSIDTNNWRDLAALVAALSFVVFLFWHLNLLYLKIIFAIGGYRVFTVSPPEDQNLLSGPANQVLITFRSSLLSGNRLIAYRLSDTVYFEAKECQPNSTLQLRN